MNSEKQRQINCHYMQRRRAHLATQNRHDRFDLNREPNNAQVNSNFIPTFDNLHVITNTTKFCNDLNSLQYNNPCSVCQEQFPFITVTK